jgi:hypothetical protein
MSFWSKIFAVTLTAQGKAEAGTDVTAAYFAVLVGNREKAETAEGRRDAKRKLATFLDDGDRMKILGLKLACKNPDPEVSTLAGRLLRKWYLGF